MVPTDSAFPVVLSRPEFLYTIDQIGLMLSISEARVKANVFFTGRTRGVRQTHEMEAVNIARPGENPEWRITEREFKRWLKRKGFSIQTN